MRRIPFRLSAACAVVILTVFLPCPGGFRAQPTAEGLPSSGQGRGASLPPSSIQPGGTARMDARRAELMEREAAVATKEQELRKLSEGLDSRIRQLEENRKSMESSMVKKKKEDAERYTKMLKIYKGLRPEEAAKLIDNLDEAVAFEMLNQMDQKTATKLIPFLNQARVLKWTKLSLKGN
jgi:hypothetical protein